MKIDIQSFLPGQEEAVCFIHNAVFAYWIEKFGVLYGYKKIHPAEIASWVNNDDDLERKLWLAYFDGKPVGYACSQLEIERDLIQAPRLLFTETKEGLGQSKIAVLPEYRRRGIASALVKHAMEFYGKLGAISSVIVLYSDNREASNFVQSLGFKKDFFTVLGEINLLRPLPKVQPNMEVTVRALEEGDLEAVTNIIQESRADLRGTFSTLEKIKQYYTQPEPWAEFSMVAELHGEVVGCMEYTSEGLIGIAGVLPRFRNQGVGSTLFRHLLLKMQAMGKNKALVDTGSVYPEAIRMYKRFGFDTSRKLWNWTKRIIIK